MCVCVSPREQWRQRRDEMRSKGEQNVMSLLEVRNELHQITGISLY